MLGSAARTTVVPGSADVEMDGRFIALAAVGAVALSSALSRPQARYVAGASVRRMGSSDLWLGPDMDAIVANSRVYGGKTAWDFLDVQHGWRSRWTAMGLPDEGKRFEDSVFDDVSCEIIDRSLASGGRFVVDVAQMDNVDGLLRPARLQTGPHRHRITSREIGYLLAQPGAGSRVVLFRKGRTMPLSDWKAGHRFSEARR
jgi:hypothetical protein